MLVAFEYPKQGGSRVTIERDIQGPFTRSQCQPDNAPNNPTKVSTWKLRDVRSLSIDYSFGAASRIPRHDLSAILLRSKTTLQRLELVDTAPLVGALPYPLHISLPCLRTLILGFRRAASLLPLIHSLHLPILDSIVLRDISRVPESHTPRHHWGAVEDGMDPSYDGGHELLQALRAFPTITRMQIYGLRCCEPTTLFEELTLTSLVLVDADEVFASLICSVPAWQSRTPALTHSGRSLVDLAIAGRNHKMFQEFLRKRCAGGKSGMRQLAMSPGYIHEAFSDRIDERSRQIYEQEAGTRLIAALHLSQNVSIIPQPVHGMPYEPQEKIVDVTEDDILEKRLWGMISQVAEIISMGSG
ncbi:hypothetical protein HWV62_801 [Athelia sp. TMB]|nr:hypothetical protein HWV62_801 [Athelia sp. TMB]